MTTSENREGGGIRLGWLQRIVLTILLESQTLTVVVGAIAYRAVPATPAHHVTLKHVLPWTELRHSQQICTFHTCSQSSAMSSHLISLLLWPAPLSLDHILFTLDKIQYYFEPQTKGRVLYNFFHDYCSSYSLSLSSFIGLLITGFCLGSSIFEG